MDTGESGRFRRFTREWIAERGENLDISWLKDDSQGDAIQELDPRVVAKEAMDELQAALVELREIIGELGKN